MESKHAHRVPNRGTTEAVWLEIMDRFKAGETDAALGRAYNVSTATVANQRSQRGIRREDHPRPTVRPSRSLAALDAGAAASALVLPEGDDPVATADALLAFSRTLMAAGRFDEAITITRLSRSQLLTLDARRRVLSGAGLGAGGGFEAEEAPAPPALRDAQRAPAGDWRTWLFLGGRGAGKTLAGAAWLAAQARRVERLAVVAPTLGDAREVMIDGPSGLRGLAAGFGPKGAAPVYEPSRRRLTWSNGAVGMVFSAEDPESLRGPQFAAAWADELCAWARPEAVVGNLRLGLRLGDAPRLCVTTTPRPTAMLRALLAEPGLAVTRGSAAENAAWLAPGFVEGLRALYGGTRLERQEIDGEVLEAPEGAVFRACEIERARALGAAERAARLGPVQVMAEANQGGEMVRQVLETAGLREPVRLVHASVGKAARAEPVALLYEQGRVAHRRGLEALEDQLLLLGAAAERGGGGASPDRADALVWALTGALLDRRWEGPRVWTV